MGKSVNSLKKTIAKFKLPYCSPHFLISCHQSMLCGSKVTIRENRVVQTKDQGKQHFDGITCLKSSFKFTWSRALEEYFLTFSAHGKVTSDGDCLNTGSITVSMKVLCSGWPWYWCMGETCGRIINKNSGADFPSWGKGRDSVSLTCLRMMVQNQWRMVFGPTGEGQMVPVYIWRMILSFQKLILKQALIVVLQWCFNHNFSIRLYALVALKKIWSMCKGLCVEELEALTSVIESSLSQVENMHGAG